MRYEWKARLFVGLVCLLIGMTLGWLSGDAGYSKWWVYGIDLIFLGVVVRFLYKAYINENHAKSNKGEGM